jgi:spermidine/putrescine transport system permease protein
MRRFFAQCYIWLLLVVLYAPIVFIAVFSFTESKVLGNWTGFSTKLYSNLFTGDMQGSGSLMSAIQNTLLIALVAASVSTLIGTIAAIGIHNMKGRSKQAITFLNNIPMLNPDIITGVSLFLLFVFLHISQGYATVILAHITFCTPYVVLSVLPKLTQMNPNIYEAALDLGATPFQTFTKTIIPMTMPGIISAASMVFMPTMSSYVISDVMGERQISLIGNTIQTYFDKSLWNIGSLVALVMLVIILITSFMTRNIEKQEDARGGLW